LFAEAHGDATARLSHAFLRRAGGQAHPASPANPALHGAMQIILRHHSAVHLAVVIAPPDAPLADLLPTAATQTAVLHIAPEFPAFLPQTGTLQSGATMFRMNLDPAALAALLQTADLRIDFLAVLGADPIWFQTLTPYLAGHCILAGDTPLPASITTHPTAERPLTVAGIDLCFIGGWFLPVTYTEAVTPEPHAPPIPDPPITGLCVAAIMRNEQAAIANMIASAAPIAETFVLLDTGSSDETISRAEAALRETNRAYALQSFQSDRFDTMRNQALSLAPANTTWILMLDADEELCREDHTALRALLDNPTHDAYALPRYNYTGPDKSGEVTPYPDRQVRLLRYRPENPLCYSGAVHETVRDVDTYRLPLDATALGLDRGGPHIHHLVRRFRTPQAEAAKQEFYQAIAAKNQ
jgi:hypothetical protein